MAGEHCLATKHDSLLLGTPCAILQHPIAMHNSASAACVAAYALAEEPEHHVSVMLQSLACFSGNKFSTPGFHAIWLHRPAADPRSPSGRFTADVGVEAPLVRASQHNLTV